MADKQVNVKINTQGDVSGANNVIGKLQQMKNEGGLVGKAVGSIGLSGVASLARMASVIGLVVVALQAAKRSVQEFAQAQENVTSLDAALANQGQLTDSYRQRLHELAGTLQETTSIADDSWFKVITRLTQFGATEETIYTHIDAVKSLAGIMDGDVEKASQAWSKAMKGNFESLKKLGISIKDNVQLTEKLKQAQIELAKIGGGMLEGRAKTLNGQFRALKNATSDLFEAIGNAFSKTGVLQGALAALHGATKALTTLFPSTIKQVADFNNNLNAVKPSAEDAADGLETSKEAAKKAADAFKQAAEDAKALRQAQDELADAQEALELAQVDLDEESGKIDAATAMKKRSSIRQQFGQKRFERDENLLKEEKQALLQSQKNKLTERDLAQGDFSSVEGQLNRVVDALEQIGMNLSDFKPGQQFGLRGAGRMADASGNRIDDLNQKIKEVENLPEGAMGREENLKSLNEELFEVQRQHDINTKRVELMKQLNELSLATLKAQQELKAAQEELLRTINSNRPKLETIDTRSRTLDIKNKKFQMEPKVEEKRFEKQQEKNAPRSQFVPDAEVVPEETLNQAKELQRNLSNAGVKSNLPELIEIVKTLAAQYQAMMKDKRLSDAEIAKIRRMLGKDRQN